TQQIIAEESGVADTVDPVAGSWAIEARTDQIEHDARALIDSIDAMGGTLPAIERGWIQRQIQDAAYATQQAIDSGSQVIVGVNRHVADARVPIPTLEIPPGVEARQKAAVAALRASRDDASCRTALAALSTAAADGRNLVPVVLEAVERRATLGEVSDTLRAVFGEYHDAG